MKYKFLIVMGLILAGFSILSCNQQGKSQQAEEAIADEESAKEEKWDSIVIAYYKEYKYIKNYNETGSLIIYPDGTAKKGKDHGYWNYGSFYRGESEFGYVNITINTFSIYYEQYIDIEYYISQENDMIWITRPGSSDGYKDMVANNSERGFKIVSWDTYYYNKRVETSQPETRNDMRTDGQDHQQSDDTGEDSFFCQQVDKWNDMHHQRRFEDSSNNPYAETVMFYGKRMTGKEVVKLKQDLLHKSPDFRQECYNIKVVRLSDNRVQCNFGKRVTINGKTKEYPSYLYFTKESGDNWLIDEESDEITDRNLKK